MKYRTKLKTALMVVGALFILGTLFLPVENIFYRFQNPKSAFLYSEKGKILNITEYENSAAILHQESDGSFQFTVLNRDSRGWMINNPSFGYDQHTLKADKLMLIYQYVADNIMFVHFVDSSANASVEVQNENGPMLATYSVGDDAYRIHIYYGFVKFNKGYFITFNGKKIEIVNHELIEPVLIIYPVMIVLVICVFLVVKKARKLLNKSTPSTIEYKPYKKI